MSSLVSLGIVVDENNLEGVKNDFTHTAGAGSVHAVRQTHCTVSGFHGIPLRPFVVELV